MKSIKKSICLFLALLMALATLFACKNSTEEPEKPTGTKSETQSTAPGSEGTKEQPTEAPTSATPEPDDPPAPAMPTKLPVSEGSVYATGADFETVKLEFASEFRVVNPDATKVDLTAPVAVDAKMVGFLIRIESDGVFHLSFSPLTDKKTDGYGFDGAKGYSVFRYKSETSEWKEYTSKAWNAQNLVAGLYFIPKDAYTKFTAITSEAKLIGFSSVGRGDTMTITEAAMVIADVPQPTPPEEVTTAKPTEEQPKPTTFDKLPTSTGSVFATGASYQATALELESAFEVANGANVTVKLKTPAVLTAEAAGLLVKIESEAAFNLSFTVATTKLPAGHGFDSGKGYSIFEWDAATSTWKEHHSTAWNVANLTGGIYFIPMDAYSTYAELTAGNSIVSFTSVGRGGPMKVTEVSLVTVSK
mgnify:CR=1 FL=1